MMQWFHWYSDGDGNHWRRLIEAAPELAAAGITALWLPPASKGNAGGYDVGYGCYDLFDLGEFDQKGSIRTKYGTRDEYLDAIKICHGLGIQVYADVVFNHKMGADFEEDFQAIPFDDNNRTIDLGPCRPVRAWTGFNFSARQDKYSTMHWNWWHFASIDYNCDDPNFHAIWRMKDSGFANNVDTEKGNYDYLMGCDLNMNHPEVSGELKHWGKWMLDSIGIDGFRLDALKHIDSNFFIDWISDLETHCGHKLFIVGEYWSYDLACLSWYISKTAGKMSLFDAPLHLNFHQASRGQGHYNMANLLAGTLMQTLPTFAVTVVENHDTQPLQALESVVEAWFKPLAYACILLRAEGYPCIFYPDYYGASYKDKGQDGNDYEISLPSHRASIDQLLLARRHFAFGPQKDYFDHFSTVGWSRLGSAQHPHGMAVLMSNGDAGFKWMEVGKSDTAFIDCMGHLSGTIISNQDGWAEFHCPGGSVSVWVEAAAYQALQS
jgi:alpha-amylase